jgi:hypothetical protein
MREAMKELGYVDTYHMMSASIENPPDALMWRDAFAAKYDNGPAFTREHWDKFLGHCQAVCDWPAVAFAKELIEAYFRSQSDPHEQGRPQLAREHAENCVVASH